jgi:hypothetical protein
LVLDPGDFMLGSVTNGYLLYDASTLNMGLTMATAGSPYLTITPSAGIHIQVDNSFTYAAQKGYTFGTATTPDLAGLYAYASGTSRVLGLRAPSDDYVSTIEIQAISSSTKASQVHLTAGKSGSSTELILFNGPDNSARIYAEYLELNNFAWGYTQLKIIDGSYSRFLTSQPSFYFDHPAYIDQTGSAAEIPTLRLSQADVSEEFIEFDGTVATGNPIDTAALGIYYGKIRVSVNGTFRYIPLYN